MSRAGGRIHTRRAGIRLLIASWTLAILVMPASARSPDPDRGAQLHGMCLPCHGTELYVPPRRKVTSLAGLRKEVERWNRSYNPKLTSDERADLVAWLNREFYKFPDP